LLSVGATTIVGTGNGKISLIIIPLFYVKLLTEKNLK